MNKKIVILLAGMVSSFVVNAAPVAVTAGALTTITTTDCDQLSEDVKINLSKDVRGAVECNSDDKVLAIATCHTAGRQKFNAPLTDAATGVVTPTDVTAGVIFTASSLGGKVGVIEGVDGCATDPTDAATAAGTPPAGS